MDNVEKFLNDNRGKEVFLEDLSTAMLICLAGSCEDDKSMTPNYIKYNITLCFHKSKIKE